MRLPRQLILPTSNPKQFQYSYECYHVLDRLDFLGLELNQLIDISRNKAQN